MVAVLESSAQQRLWPCPLQGESLPVPWLCPWVCWEGPLLILWLVRESPVLRQWICWSLQEEGLLQASLVPELWVCWETPWLLQEGAWWRLLRFHRSCRSALL